MPSGAMIPPWIQPGDPTAAAAQGFQIGARIGSEQASQAMEQQRMQFEQQKMEFAQQQALREQQLAAQAEARQQAKFGLEASEAARKTTAQLQYQQAVQGGMDPLKALIQFGPSMTGQASAEAAAIRSQQMQNKAPLHYSPFEMGGVKGIMRSDMGHFIPDPKESDSGPTKAYPVVDSETGKPVAGFIATRSPSGKGMTVHVTKPDAEASVSQALSAVDRLPQMEQITPGTTTNLGPALVERVRRGILPKGPAKTTVQEAPLPFPKSKKDAVKGSVYLTKHGPMTWDGEKFVAQSTDPAGKDAGSE